jgi:Phosphomannomutase
MSAKTSIRFGTDGWRGIIAEDFTYDNVKRVASAMALYLKEASSSPVVAVGYDTRFGSRRFAEIVADILTASGCEVLFSDSALSTPAISSSVVDAKAAGGVMISASHNPPEFNGIKFKTPQGCSAPEDVTRRFETLLDKPLAAASTPGNRESRNFLPAYFKRITKAVDFSVIKKSSVKVVADPMCGAATGYLERLLKPASVRLVSINTTPDPLFGGLHPEPIEAYLENLKKAVKQNGASCGLATDGDGDRIGVVDEHGRYLTPHQVFPLLLYYLCHFKKLKGKVVQAISLGYVSERIAKDYGLDLEETPVGFKYVADRIINEKILMGGEESGGYGYGNYLPERDGILNSMLIIEMLASTRRTLSSLLGEIEKIRRITLPADGFREPRYRQG